LLDKLKSWSCKKPACGCATESPCVTPGAPVVAPPTSGTTPPKDMPKLKEVPKTDSTKTSSSTGSLSIPAVPSTPPLAPNPVGLPPIPATPISSGGSLSGYSPY
jgi:hypothetical protein